MINCVDCCEFDYVDQGPYGTGFSESNAGLVFRLEKHVWAHDEFSGNFEGTGWMTDGGIGSLGHPSSAEECFDEQYESAHSGVYPAWDDTVFYTCLNPASVSCGKFSDIEIAPFAYHDERVLWYTLEEAEAALAVELLNG